MVRIERVTDRRQLDIIRDLGIVTPEFTAGDTVIFWPLETLQSWYESDAGAMLVALSDTSEIVGYALATYHGSKIATFENLQVLSEWRGTGIGHRLISALESDAQLAGMEFVRTLFKVANDPIASLFSNTNRQNS